jgi:replicative DNA helicase
MSPSFNEELEYYILLGCLMSDEVADAVMGVVTEDHFFDAKAQALYSACKTAWDKHKTCDLSMVLTVLRDAGKTELIGGATALEQDIGLGIHLGILEQSIRDLHGFYLQRRVIKTAGELATQAYAMDGYDAVEKFVQLASNISGNFSQVVSERGDIMLEKLRQSPLPPKITTGVPKFDHHIHKDSGMYRGQIEITIADSGHGKTTYAMYKALRVMEQGYKVAWYQLEDSPRKTLERIAFANEALLQKIFITSRIRDIEDIKRDLRTLKRQHEIDYVVVDYIQNVSCKNAKGRTDEVEYASRELTSLMDELQVVGHVLSQVTIDSKTRKGWQLEPRYSDVRQSQQIKQDAHLITSVFRPYVIETLQSGDKAIDWNGTPSLHKDSVFIRQRKVRDGEITNKTIHMIHTDKGLRIASEYFEETAMYNHGITRKSAPELIIPSFYEISDTPF